MAVPLFGTPAISGQRSQYFDLAAPPALSSRSEWQGRSPSRGPPGRMGSFRHAILLRSAHQARKRCARWIEALSSLRRLDLDAPLARSTQILRRWPRHALDRELQCEVVSPRSGVSSAWQRKRRREPTEEEFGS